MEIRHIVKLVRKWLWLLVFTCVLGGAVGLLVSLVQPKIYDASTSLLISSPNRDDSSAIIGDQQVASAFTVFPTSTSVLHSTIQAIGDPTLTPAQLTSMITVTNDVNTQVIRIDVKDKNPGQATLIANEVAQLSITQFKQETIDNNVSESFLLEEINQLEGQIKNLEQQLSTAQSATQIDTLNAQLANLRTSYNGLLTSYANLNGFQVTQVQQAEIPQTPISPKPLLAVAIGVLAGLLFMICIIFIVEQTDDGLRTPKKIMEITGLSTLIAVGHLAIPSPVKAAPSIEGPGKNGHIGKQVGLLAKRDAEFKDEENEKGDTIKLARVPAVIEQSKSNSFHDTASKARVQALVMQTTGELSTPKKKLFRYNLLAEEFLTLGTLISVECTPQATDRHLLRSILVASPEGGDGKTLVASQVALALARIGMKVVLIDANLRNPGIHTIFGLENENGLSVFLRKNLAAADSTNVAELSLAALQETAEPNLKILTSGPIVDSPSELLSSPAMLTVLQQLSQEALVVIDSPAVLTSSETVLMASKSDSILLIVNARHTTATKLNRSQEVLTRVNENILGVVLNEAGRQR